MAARTALRAVAASTLIAATAAVSFAAPAAAEPPVAVDDHRRMWAGDVREFNVLANDSDPDGDELAVCRVAPPTDETFFYEIVDGNIVVFAPPDLSGEIAITYYACDFETLVPATLTITIREVLPVTVVKAKRPGRIRVTNDNERAVRFLWGSFENDEPDGRTWVAAHDAKSIRVRRRAVDWIAIFRGNLIGIGRVRGIELPRGTARTTSPAVDLTRAEARAWAAQR